MGKDQVIHDWRQWQEEKIEEILDELMTELEDEPSTVLTAVSPDNASETAHVMTVSAQHLTSSERPGARGRGDRPSNTVVLRSATVATSTDFRQGPPNPPRPPMTASYVAAATWPAQGLFEDRQLLLTAIALLAGTAALAIAHILRTPNPQIFRQQAFLAHMQESLAALESEAIANQPQVTTAAVASSKPLPTVTIATPPPGALARPGATLPPPAASLIPPSRAPLAVVRAPVVTLPPPPPILPPTSLAVADIPLNTTAVLPTFTPPASPPQATAPSLQTAIAPAVVPSAPVTQGLRLKGVMVMGNESSAMFSFDGSVQTPVRVGEAVGTSGWRLKRVDGQSAVLVRNGKQRVIGIDSGL